MTGRTGKYQDLGRIMEFIYNSEKFTDWKTWEIRNAVGYAVEHQKYFLHWRQLPGHYKQCLGFCTWGFFKRDEIDNQFWHGNEAYSRCDNDEGEVLYFPMFLCLGGAKEVLKFVRSIQQFVYKHYPDIAVAEGWRDYSKQAKRKAIMHIVRSNRYG